jgi:hypothetical protein
MEYRANIINDRVPQWLVERMHNCANQERYPHYEASLSGPHNEFLHCHFPYQLQYMVKPIPRLRTIAEPNETARTSLDSYDQPVLTQGQDPVPDFLVCKATESLHGDRPFLIWELKRNSASANKSENQFNRYEDWLARYQDFKYNPLTRSSPRLWMAVVEGDMVTVELFEHVEDRNEARVVFTTVHRVLSQELDIIINRMRAWYP